MDAHTSTDSFLFGQFRLDRLRGLSRFGLAGDPAPVSLGSRALDVLRVLIERHGDLVSKDEIMAAVWSGTTVEEANLTVQISTLRRVLDQANGGQSCIQTVPGRGYRFVLPVTRAEEGPQDLTSAPFPDLAPTRERVRLSLPRWYWLAALGGFAAVVAVTWIGGWFASQTLPPLSLVVLPFDNLAGNHSDNYLAAAVTDDLTAELSHIPGAFVISRATAYSYNGKAENIRQVGRELGIRYVVRGSMQRVGSLIWINAELGSTETGAQVWSASFSQKIDSLVDGQDQIVIQMRSALNISLAEIEAARSLRERSTNPDSFNLIVRARAAYLLPMTKDTLTQAMSLYEVALQHDPDAVLALTGAANTLLTELVLEMVPYYTAIDRAERYIERARRIQPNAEVVLASQTYLLVWQQASLNWRQAMRELEAVSKQLIEYYPNNPQGYNELGVLRRNQGRYDEAINLYKEAIRRDPRAPVWKKNNYWNIAYCYVASGHDREGLEWADRTLTVAGTLGPAFRVRVMLAYRTVASYRTGDISTAEHLAQELNEQFPLATWRQHFPEDPDSDTNREQFRSWQHALKAAGVRDHLDPEADFGVTSDDALHQDLQGKTPTAAPGVTTLSTEQFIRMLENERPLVIDTMNSSWNRSVPGAVGLSFRDHTYGTFDDTIQRRLVLKMRQLTGENMAKSIVALSFNASFFDGYNLALRLRHAGYTNVYWYRGGREAWEVAGKPEAAVEPANW